MDRRSERPHAARRTNVSLYVERRFRFNASPSPNRQGTCHADDTGLSRVNYFGSRAVSTPEVLEPMRRQLGISDRVLDVLVAKVVLQGSRVVAIICQLEPTGVAKHVRVDQEWHLGGLPEALDEPMESNGTDWPAALGNEYVGVGGVIAA